MHKADFQFLATFFKRRSGLAFGLDKAPLAERRLMLVARRYGLRNLEDLVTALKAGEEPLATEATQVMTVNDTSFFRDIALFEALHNEILPPLMRARSAKRSIRIWSAACASGQEPYSIAMMLQDVMAQNSGVADWDFEIFATDLSADMIAHSRAGCYDSLSLQKSVPPAVIARNFQRRESEWQISESLRGMVKFQQFNLLYGYENFGRFDLIFCRNVLLYFDAASRKDVLQRMSYALAEDGKLILGAAESVLGIGHHFEARATFPGVYRKPEYTYGGAHAAAVA